MTVTCYRYVLEEKVLEVEIEPGMRDGYQYPFVAEGTHESSQTSCDTLSVCLSVSLSAGYTCMVILFQVSPTSTVSLETLFLSS